MAGRQLVSSGAKWEDKVGYSRGVRVTTGTFDFIEIAGTTAPGNGAYEQTRHALQKVACPTLAGAHVAQPRTVSTAHAASLT